MPLLSRSVELAAPPEAVWELVADAHSLPRWWPGVQRVEGVSDTGFTEVLYTRKGRPVRIDFHYNEVDDGSILGWEQEIAGSPFERLLTLWRTRLLLAPAGEGRTHVTLEEEQRFRGSFGLGSWMQRRAAKRRLGEALAGLAELF